MNLHFAVLTTRPVFKRCTTLILATLFILLATAPKDTCMGAAHGSGGEDLSQISIQVRTSSDQVTRVPMVQIIDCRIKPKTEEDFPEELSR